MNKIYIKLTAMALALVLSVSVVLMSSYAWLVLSGNPVATGIQVAIGGGNTILMAPNVLYTAKDKTVWNIPGRFSDKMNFGQQESYAYLQNLGNLTPVSTTNGVDWFLPTYYDGNDEEVQQGKIASGALRDISAFQVDSELTHANLSADQTELIREGNYIYLDFWVVSPGGDYKLRVSTGVDDVESKDKSVGGSFVIDLMEPVLSEGEYVLQETAVGASAAVRIGFLANDIRLLDDTMAKYNESPYFDERFTALKGMYREPNSGTYYTEADHFTIYEPNADYHPTHPELDGSYVKTEALMLESGQKIAHANRNVTVQKRSTWAPAEEGEGTAIAQRFNTALYALIWDKMNADTVSSQFYNNYMQGQLSTYVNKGGFVARTGNLFGWMGQSDTVPAEYMQNTADNTVIKGATDDVEIITLERNVPQRIRMFIWLEGQDVDCVDKISSSSFAVNIELAGGNE